MSDQRDVCGCHRGCSIEPHECAKPCRWPNCLPPEQLEKLLLELREELF